jgi:hypothetical protein
MLINVFNATLNVLIGSHFVQLEGKFLLLVLAIVRITLNVIVHQMFLNVC